MSVYERYLEAKSELDAAKKRFENYQVELYNRFQNDLNKLDTGTFSAEDRGYRVKIIKKESVSVDQKLASVVDIGFRKKYELDKAGYKKLTKADQKRVDECLTTKPAKPTFSVERIEEDE